MEDPFSLLIKPASADCNLCCDYCFYLGKNEPYSQRPRMDDKTLERLMEAYLGTSQPVYSMTWQGGEPALMGADFYARAIALQKQFARPGSRMMNALQTNATCLSDEMAALMGKYRFLAGCSLDGPADIHDVFRTSGSKKPTHSRVMAGINTLAENGVPVNVLCMVTSANVDDPVRVYTYFKEKGFDFIQFIPCVEHDDSGNPLPWSITGEQWGTFLAAVFDQWHAGDTRHISVRNFESLLAKLVMGQAAECRMAGRCDQYLVVEYNGDIYACDFFVTKESRLGNIHETSFEAIRKSDGYRRFAREKSHHDPRCGGCDYFHLCMGDCQKFRGKAQEHQEMSLLCPGWHHFYKTTLERFNALASAISKNSNP